MSANPDRYEAPPYRCSVCGEWCDDEHDCVMMEELEDFDGYSIRGQEEHADEMDPGIVKPGN